MLSIIIQTGGAALRPAALETKTWDVTLRSGSLRFRLKGGPGSIEIRVRDRSVLDQPPPPDLSLLEELRSGLPRSATKPKMPRRAVATGVTVGNTPALYHPSEDLLNEFFRLSDGSDEQVLGFARKYGPLGLCAHDLPAGHARSPFGDTSDIGLRRAVGEKVGPCRVSGWKERVSAWRAWSGFARALVSLADDLHDGKLPNLDGADWRSIEAVTGPGEQYRMAYLGRRVVEQKQRVSRLVDTYWLGFGFVRPVFSWRGDEPGFVLGAPFANALFSALAVQLVLAVAGSKTPLETCSNPKCRKSYFPTRIPRAGERHWCQDCGKRAAKTAAQRAYEVRQRARRLVRDERLPLSEAARRLGTDEVTIRSYLKRMRKQL